MSLFAPKYCALEEAFEYNSFINNGLVETSKIVEHFNNHTDEENSCSSVLDHINNCGECYMILQNKFSVKVYEKSNLGLFFNADTVLSIMIVLTILFIVIFKPNISI